MKNYLIDSDIIWLAGLFDGEGTVGISNGKSRYGLRLCVNMVHKATIDRIASIFGSGVVKPKETKRYIKNARQAWSINLCGDNAYRFLKMIEPYSFTKRDEIILAIEYYETILKPNRTYNDLSPSARKLTDDQRNLRELYHLKLKQLKRYETLIN